MVLPELSMGELIAGISAILNDEKDVMSYAKAAHTDWALHQAPEAVHALTAQCRDRPRKRYSHV